MCLARFEGAGWAGCDCYPDLCAGFERDHGAPSSKGYSETAPGSAVFARSWTKADVSLDCNTGTAVIAMKQSRGEQLQQG